MELSIDTSTSISGIALSKNGALITEYSWTSNQNHTVELMPQINRLLTESNVRMNQLKAIFIAIGPGSFNGLRAGISTAKGFCEILRIPLIGISTLEIEAYAFHKDSLDIRPIHNAGRGEIATALYRTNNGIWECILPPYITKIDSLVKSITQKTIFCGEIPENLIEKVKDELKELAIIPEKEMRLRKPRFLAELGWLRLQSNLHDDPLTLEPIYLRHPPITLPKPKQAKKSNIK